MDLTASDFVDIAAALGSLQLLPENADLIIRLEAASASLACGQSLFREKPIDREYLTSWLCDSEWAETFKLAEDSFPNLFTEAITFASGSFIVLPGPEEGIIFIVRQLLELIAVNPDDETTAFFCRQARDMALAILIVGDEVARRAGLRRHIEPSTASARVHIPTEDQLTRLKAAVVFQPTEISQLLEPHGIEPRSLDPFILELGSAEWSGEPWANPLVLRPLLRPDQTFVVAAPNELLSSLVRAIFRLASGRGLLAALAFAFRQTLYVTAQAHLECLGSRPLQPPTFELNGLPACEGFFSLDNDKIVHLLIVSDDLDGWSPETASISTWDTRALTEELKHRCQTVAQKVSQASPWVRKALHLIVIQGLCRFYSIGFHGESETGSLMLLLPAELLEIITLLEHSDPLALWKYARAIHSRSAETRYLPLSPLAEYELYRSHRRSFYFSDGAPPNRMILVEDLSAKLRSRLASKYHRHGALLPSEGRWVEVLSLDPDSNHPAYFDNALDGRLRIIVELEDIAIWLLTPEGSLEPPYGSLYMQFSRAVAYWLWQIEPSLKPILGLLGARIPALELQIEVIPDQGWFAKVQHSYSDQKGISWSIGAPNCAFLQFACCVSNHFLTDNNAGDRILVAELARLLYACCERLANLPPQSGDSRMAEEIVENHAPLGLKRMVAFVQASESDLCGEALARYRAVQNADQEAVLDEMGSYLQTQLPWRPGRALTKPESLHSLNKHVVPFLFNRLKELVVTLRPERLLENLAERHEALLRAQKQYGLSLPARLACYGDEREFTGQIRREADEHRETAVSSRFLIEYICQQPPSGSESLSLECYDRLLALSSQIFTWGTTSDYIHYGLGDLCLTMLPSGRLGVSRDNLERAQQTFSDDAWLHEVSRRTENYSKHWRSDERLEDEKTPELAELDLCTQKEFGLSLTDLVEFLGAIAAVGQSQKSLTKVTNRPKLLKAVTEKLGWNSEQADMALDFFALKPRRSFLEVPKPFEKEDCYPWRFNRRLSYIRKPLLCRGEPVEAEVVWGVGQLEDAVEYLINLCLAGRLKAQTSEMKRFISKAQQGVGKNFNEAVAKVFDIAGVSVSSRVKKIGRHRLAHLGDIDVLVVSPASRTILAVEAKDLHAAKTPAEMDHEFRDTFDPDTRSAAVKHLERVAWLRAHVEDTLVSLNLGTELHGEWLVHGCIVVSTALVSSYLSRCPIQVIPWVRLRDEVPRLLNRGWTG